MNLSERFSFLPIIIQAVGAVGFARHSVEVPRSIAAEERTAVAEPVRIAAEERTAVAEPVRIAAEERTAVAEQVRR